MTEGHEDDFLVRVRAQVMTRDESTEGWLPMSGGGLAHVSIRKRAKLPPDMSGHEYIIFGQRISDQTVILSCVINRDLQYFKVMPTFHHWRAGKQRNGLTFQTAADARAFDKGIVKAYDDLLTDGADEKSKTGSWDKYDSLVGEDDVFMTLDLPCEPSESRSGSEGSGSQKSDKHSININYISPPLPAGSTSGGATTSTTNTTAGGVGGGCSSAAPLAISPTSLSRRYSPPSAAGTLSSSSPSPPLHHPHPQAHHHNQSHHHHHQTSVVTHPPSSTGRIATISASPPGQTLGLSPPPPPSDGDAVLGGHIAPGDNYYVQLHDDPPLIRATRRDSTCSLKKRTGGGGGGDSPSLIMKESTGFGLSGLGGAAMAGLPMKARLRCRYCQEFYTEEWNTKGACDYAPDCFRTMIDRLPGMPCARGLVYHCMSDAEGDTVAHPCDCAGGVDGSCTKRWFGLALLSLLMPCLWCYPPMRACHYVGISCGVCGGKHKPYV